MSELNRKLRVAVVGATGYSGQELIRLLANHPHAELTYIAGNHETDMKLQAMFPQLIGAQNLRMEKFLTEECLSLADVSFVALPSGVSGEVAAALWKQGQKVIDLSGDLRLPAETYQSWYGKTPVAQEVVEQAVYGLTEWHRKQLMEATLVANPGCYATASLLALLPVVKHGLAAKTGVPLIIDAKSGVSGAGRNAVVGHQLAELAENFYPYKIARHQHTPEIEQALQASTLTSDSPQRATSLKVLLTTQLLPAVRGIYAVCYVPIQAGISAAKIYEAYQSSYQDEPFVHVLEPGVVPELKQVRGSNQTFLGLALDERTGILQVFAVLDNLQKGAAGQAIQNFNLMHGLAETTGLMHMPLYP